MQEQKWGPLLRNEQQKKAEDVTEAEAEIQQAGSTQLLITNQHLLELRLFRYINIVTNPHQNASHFDLFVSENVFLFVEFCILFNSLLFLNPKGSKMSCFVCFRLCDELMVFFFLRGQLHVPTLLTLKLAQCLHFHLGYMYSRYSVK